MTKDKHIIIAIDGHSSCGKSTLAKDIAVKLGYIYVDTGAMYRAVTLYAIENSIIKNGLINESKLQACLSKISITFSFDVAKKRSETFLDGQNIEEAIRSMEVNSWVSQISAIAFVRAQMVEQQRKMGVKRGIVMDGRDIGTVVFPDAELKIFLTASPQVRAQRRFDEMQQKGIPGEYNEILQNLKHRDDFDSNRTESPLRQADDAIILDNSNLTKEEQMDWVLAKVDELKCT